MRPSIAEVFQMVVNGSVVEKRRVRIYTFFVIGCSQILVNTGFGYVAYIRVLLFCSVCYFKTIVLQIIF